ncbi:hypothetical protein MCEMRE212_00470 [Candidatus Nanopelagicaceae bacterium]
MTSQIVLMNKIGLAVASDSSLTMSRGDNRRTYASAEKIFPLDKNHKVAILHSGTVEFMEHPFEVLLTEWSKSLQRPFGTLDEYVESFCIWLAHRQDLFPEESQLEFFEDLLTGYYLEVRRALLKELEDKGISADEWKTEETLSEVNVFLDSDLEYLDSLEDLEGLNSKWADSRFQTVQAAVTAAVEYVFDDVPRDSVSDSKYESIARKVLYKRIFSNTYDARLAFVGYGEKAIYPKHVWVDYQGVVGDKPRYVKDSKEISTATSSALRTHAQDEAIHTFLRAYHQSFYNIAQNFQRESLRKLTDLLIQNLGNPEDEELMKTIDSFIEERITGIGEEFERVSSVDFVQPFTSTLSGLPSTSLGKMAENLIELQILRQSSQAIQDTVGGPVDVAVITLEKGFEWFRHKNLDDLWGNI